MDLLEETIKGEETLNIFKAWECSHETRHSFYGWERDEKWMKNWKLISHFLAPSLP